MDIDGDFTIAVGPFNPLNFNHTVAGNWDSELGLFDAGTGTGKITFDGATSANIKTGPSNDFHHFEINTTADKTVTTNNLNIDGDLTITAGTFNPGAFSHDIAGNWDDVAGTFQATDGEITISGSGPSTIKTGTNNNFNNLTIDGTIETFSDNDIEIGGVLDVNDTKTLTVVAGDRLTFTGNLSAHTIVGTLTMNTSAGNNSTLDFTGSTSNTVVVDGTLNLNGTDATGQALVTGAADPALVNLEFPSGASGTGNGLFNGKGRMTHSNGDIY